MSNGGVVGKCVAQCRFVNEAGRLGKMKHCDKLSLVRSISLVRTLQMLIAYCMVFKKLLAFVAATYIHISLTAPHIHIYPTAPHIHAPQTIYRVIDPHRPSSPVSLFFSSFVYLPDHQ
jgi:hypothetical protein